MAGVLLVIPPFHQVFIPAIGVSLLKAALTRIGIPCDLLYLNIPYAEQIGAELYSDIASAGRFRALTGEWIFAGDLFGDRSPDPRRYIEEVLLGRYAEDYDRAFADRLAELRADAPAFLDRVMDRVDWERYALVGVSSSYHQNCAGLALLQRLKARHPTIRTALGGANCEGPMGAALHELFPFVDYVCSGEGDRVFPELVRRVLNGEAVSGLPGIHARGELNLLGDDSHTPLVRDLDQLPYPDYDDYFAQFEASGLPAVETPTLSLETSRGCWWGQKHHCTFCGLNGQGMTYRAKSPRRALDELDHLLDRYRTRKVYAIDNILDLGYFRELLPALARRPLPPRLFYETKANLTKDQLRLLARAGVKGIQPGVESFSTPILRLMDKGTTGLQNVRLLRWCAELGLTPAWGILFGFPGEDPAEYQHLAELLPSLTHLEPPAGFGQIRLDRFSPYFAAPAERGLVNARANLAYRHVYPVPPAALDRLAYHFDYEYADGRDPHSYTAEVKAQVAIWQARHEGARLELQLADDRLEIHDSRPAAVHPVTILEGPARLTYLALDAGATLRGVQAALQPTLGTATPPLDQLSTWLEAWLADRLVMREGDRYLSLATNPAERVQLPIERFLAELAGELGVSPPVGRVLLVVPPFHQLFAPAIGVSLLKAALSRAGLGCDVLYLNIRLAEQMGPLDYTRVATEGRFDALGGDWVFAGDLFGDRAPDPHRYVDEVLLGRYADDYDHAFADRLAELRAAAPAFLDRVMDQVDWEQYALVGVSSTHAQNCAGLALLQRLKARHPAIRTALGGANCEGPMGAALHELFPFVDYVCSGEGDRVFPELVGRVLAGRPTAGLPGIHVRGEPNLLGDQTHTPLVRDLDQLPYPDYDDYFAQFEAAGLLAVETPTLSLETSRGCWWGQKHHCTFCGLNGQGMQYRTKSPRRALDEMDHLLERYPSRRFYATDNILDLSYFETVIPKLAERPRPPRLFYMTKANLTKAQLRLLARAGAWGLTPGLESLSDSVLRLMDKGTTGLQNVRALKWCAEIGLVVVWAWLCGFPGEDPAEYERLAELVPSLTHLPPPAGPYQIRLDRFSPNFNQAAAHGLVNLKAAVGYQHVYPFGPAELDRLAYYFDYNYADGRDPSSYARPLKEALAAWRTAGPGARLELRLVDDRLEIHDSRPAAVRPVTILEGPACLAYLALDAGATLRGVQVALQPALGTATPALDQLSAWLETWRADRLVIREGDRYLSLATNPAERVQLPIERFLAELAGSSA